MKNFQKTGRIASMMLILAVLALPLGLSGQGSKTSFSGSWTYNPEKSITGQGQGQGRGGQGGGDMVIKQDANLLKIERTRTNQEGQTSTVTTKYTLDGKESINSSPRGDSKSFATWSSDGKTLTVKSSRTMNRNGETVTMNSTEVWSLTDPGTLTIVSTTPTPEGERKVTAVYNKK